MDPVHDDVGRAHRQALRTHLEGMLEHPAIVNADDSRVTHEPDGFGLELESARGIKRALLEPVDTDNLEHDLSPSACMDASEDIPHPPCPEVGVKLEWSDTS